MIQLERQKYKYEKLIVLVKKKIPCISCAKNWIEVYLFSLFSVPTTMPAPTTTPEGKKDRDIYETKTKEMMMMMMIF